MGTDISIYGEVRKGSNSDWFFVELHNDYFGRHYEIYAALANVRGRGGLDPKGLPEDVGEAILNILSEFGYYSHSETYFDVFEFEVIVKKYEHNHLYLEIVNRLKQSIDDADIDNILLDTGQKAEGRFIIIFDS